MESDRSQVPHLENVLYDGTREKRFLLESIRTLLPVKRKVWMLPPLLLEVTKVDETPLLDES